MTLQLQQLEDGKLLEPGLAGKLAHECCCGPCVASWGTFAYDSGDYNSDEFVSDGGDKWTKKDIDLGDGELELQIDFDDSANCGGPNSNAQEGTATSTFNLSGTGQLRIHATGNVERQNSGFDWLNVFVDDVEVLAVDSFDEGLGCQMAQRECCNLVNLSAGNHTIRVFSTTGDELYHVGGFWNCKLKLACDQTLDCGGIPPCNSYG